VALTDPKDTLSYHQSRVLTSHRDMSEVTCADVSKAIVAFMKQDPTPDQVPESEALWFYGMNHGMSLIGARRAPLEPLSKWEQGFASRYHEVMGPKAVRAFYYLLIICTREARHNQSLSKDAPTIAKMFGEPISKFFASIKGGEGTIYNALLNKPPQATLGAYVKALQWQFYHSKWGGGYGGKKWGMVTDCLVRFVTGEFTAEMMLDTIWTLSHNNGPIFNKSVLYGMYTHNLIRILDVQRSGQVPEAIRQDKPIKEFVGADLTHLVMEMAKEFPEQIGHYVDWEVVEALGSVKKYPKEKQEQYKLYGMSEAGKAAIEAAEKKALELAAAEKKKQEEHAKNWFQVMAGLEVKKVQMARAA
jgi:hypothetical protein